jgi:hypothetical protein
MSDGWKFEQVITMGIPPNGEVNWSRFWLKTKQTLLFVGRKTMSTTSKTENLCRWPWVSVGTKNNGRWPKARFYKRNGGNLAFFKGL